MQLQSCRLQIMVLMRLAVSHISHMQGLRLASSSNVQRSLTQIEESLYSSYRPDNDASREHSYTAALHSHRVRTGIDRSRCAPVSLVTLILLRRRTRLLSS